MKNFVSSSHNLFQSKYRRQKSERRRNRRNNARRKPTLERNLLSSNFASADIPLKTRGFIRRIKNGE